MSEAAVGASTDGKGDGEVGDYVRFKCNYSPSLLQPSLTVQGPRWCPRGALGGLAYHASRSNAANPSPSLQCGPDGALAVRALPDTAATGSSSSRVASGTAQTGQTGPSQITKGGREGPT